MVYQHKTVAASNAYEFDCLLDTMSHEGWEIVAVWHVSPGQYQAYGRSAQWFESYNATCRRPEPK